MKFEIGAECVMVDYN